MLICRRSGEEVWQLTDYFDTSIRINTGIRIFGGEGRTIRGIRIGQVYVGIYGYRPRDGSVPDISVSHRDGVDNSVSRIEGNIWGEGYVYDFQLLGMCGGGPRR